MPKIDPEAATTPLKTGTGYPMPFNAPCEARSYRRLGAAGGLTDFGVNLVTVRRGSGRASATVISRTMSFSSCCRANSS